MTPAHHGTAPPLLASPKGDRNAIRRAQLTHRLGHFSLVWPSLCHYPSALLSKPPEQLEIVCKLKRLSDQISKIQI